MVRGRPIPPLVLAVRGQAAPRQDLQAVPFFVETVRNVTTPY